MATGVRILAGLLLALCIAGTQAEVYTRATDPPSGDKMHEDSDPVRVLWLPVNAAKSCSATCQKSGLRAVREKDGSAALCLVEANDIFDYYDYMYEGAVFEGTKRSEGCQYVASSDGWAVETGPVTAEDDYYCACLPPNAARTGPDAVWTGIRSNKCPKGYGLVPTVCRVELDGMAYYGWLASGVPTCIIYKDKKDGARPGYLTSTKFQSLCGPQEFAYYQSRGEA